VNRPGKFPPSHPACQYAAQQLREAGYYCEFDSGYGEWLIASGQAAALDRNIQKAMKSLLAKLQHRRLLQDWDNVRKILIQMEEIGS
jgi:hypothetical protein